MKKFLTRQKSAYVCSILLFLLTLAAFAGITVTEGEIISDTSGSTWRQIVIFDANDYDTCQAYVDFFKSKGYDYFLIPYVYGIAGHSMRSKATDTNRNVSSGSYTGFVRTNYEFNDISADYTGQIRRGTVAIDKIHFTHDYDDLDMRGSAFIYNNLDGHAESRATWN